MTPTSLERGIEIDRTIVKLRSVLTEIANERLFRTDDVHVTCSKEAMPFLVDLELETKINLNKIINSRIGLLEAEFKAL